MKNTVKKIVFSIMALVVAGAMTVPALAATNENYVPSIENTPSPKVTSVEVKDKDGKVKDKDVNVVVNSIVEATESENGAALERLEEAFEDIKSKENVKDLNEEIKEDNAIVTDLVDISIENEDNTQLVLEEGETVEVGLSTKYTNNEILYVLQYVDGKWENVKFTNDNGTITLTLTQSGPVAFIAEGEKNVESPKTADMAAVLTVSMVAMAVAFVAVKNKRH